MNPLESRGHYRSSTINRYEDFKIRQEDEEKIKESAVDISTKETPLQETPIISPYYLELISIMESIQNRIKLEHICKIEKKKSLRSQILEELFKHSSSVSVKISKKTKRENASIGKISKKVLKITPSKSKNKLSEGKAKKSYPLVPKIKGIHCRSVNLPKLPAKTLRNGSTNLDYKPSFLV